MLCINQNGKITDDVICFAKKKFILQLNLIN